MGYVEKTIFICYRRTNIPWALAIFQALTHRGYDVFIDFESIASGDFERVIVENINARAHFLVLLTPSALEGCNRTDDWLRREIETALDTQRNIVPLMLEGFDFGTPSIASQLTGKLTALKRYNGLTVPAQYFEEAMDRLRGKFLNVSLSTVLHPASSLAQQSAKDQQTEAGKAPTVQQHELTAQEWFERGFNAADPDEQLRCYDLAIHLQPDFAEAYNNRGIVRRNKGDLESAVQDYTEAIRLQPGYAKAYNNRGVVRRNKGDLEGAVRDCTEAIRLQPDYADPYNNRANARGNKSDLEGALQDYAEAIRLQPDYADAYYNRAIVRENKGDLEGALQDYAEAIRLQPAYADAYYNRAIVRENKGDLESALQDYTEAIRLQPDLAEAYNNRGLVRSDKADLEGAVQDYTEAIRLQPGYATAYNNRANARAIKGDLEGALQDWTEAIRFQPDHAESYHNRAIARSNKGDLEGAMQDYQKYLDLGGGMRNGDQENLEERITDLKKKL